MPFLSRQQINPVVLDQYAGQHKERLRQSLMDPSLTAEQRASIKDQLNALALKGPKVYRRDSLPKAGAIDNPLPIQAGGISID